MQFTETTHKQTFTLHEMKFGFYNSLFPQYRDKRKFQPY